MEEKREKQFRRIICCLLPLCLFLVWVNILPVSAQTQLSASAQIQSAAPWGTETVKETRAYYDGAYWRVPAGWYHYQPTKDVWKDLLVSNSEDYFTDYYVAVWKKADGGYELAGRCGTSGSGKYERQYLLEQGRGLLYSDCFRQQRNISTGCQLDT